MGSVTEILPELLELVVFGLGSAGLSVAGLYIERFAPVSAQSGQNGLAVWATALGAFVLGFAYLLATDKAARSFATVKRELVAATE